MFLKRIFARSSDTSQSLYEGIVAAARRPFFYADLAVPDTVDGRFDMISLHLFLVLQRLRGEGQEAEDFRQRLTDTFFADMDRSLREMGVGDLSVGKKVRKMSEVFYGRVKAYSTALGEGKGLAEALGRNVYADVPGADAGRLEAWVMAAVDGLKAQRPADLMSGKVIFP